nr:hypothetical protein CFP56_75791 [Quercus suber]
MSALVARAGKVDSALQIAGLSKHWRMLSGAHPYARQQKYNTIADAASWKDEQRRISAVYRRLNVVGSGELDYTLAKGDLNRSMDDSFVLADRDLLQK